MQPSCGSASHPFARRPDPCFQSNRAAFAISLASDRHVARKDGKVMIVQKDYSYYIRGNRVGVLLLHGLAGTPAEMRYVANGMARAGYTVHCPQLAGHCGTEEDIKK